MCEKRTKLFLVYRKAVPNGKGKPFVEPLSIIYQLLNDGVQLGSFKGEESSHNTHPQYLHAVKGVGTTRQGLLSPQTDHSPGTYQ